MEMNHYFDTAHPLRPYTHSLPANPGSIPPANALRGIEPLIKVGLWPCEKGGVWVYAEDHRERTEAKGFPAGTEQAGAEFWLPDDTWRTPARKMEDIGPMPERWSDTPPEPTQEEIAAQRLADIDARLTELQKLAAIEEEAAALRAERKVLAGE